MALFGGNKETKKEKQARLAQEAEDAKMQAEFDAKYTAKTKKKEVQKMIAAIDKTEKELIASAASAKAKGYADVYKNIVSSIKIARARKMQAEKFLFQIDSMEKMKSISDSSVGLLGAMNEIMGTLGKLSIDPAAMMESSKNFAKTQQLLEKQGMQIEQVTSSMEMVMPDDAELSDMGLTNSDVIDGEIDRFIIEQSGAFSAGIGAPAGAAASNADTDDLKKLLEI